MTVSASRVAVDLGPRPDPRAGVFETIRVSAGAAPLLEAHLVRLAGSAQELYGTELTLSPSQVRGRTPSGDARLRVSFVPGEDSLTIDHGPIAPDPGYKGIAPFVLPHGLGAHKWIDRRLIGAITAAAGEGFLPLLVDEDGSVLESPRMNVLIEERGCLFSPPADGRFRPGFGRERLRYSEEPVGLDRLLAADALVLTSALRTVRISMGR